MKDGEAEASVHMDRGSERMSAGEFEEAIVCFDQAVKLEPGNAEALLGRGACWHHVGEHGNALADCDEAIRLDPGLAPAYLYRGSLRLQRGETVDGIEDYDEAIRLQPEMARAYEYRAHAWIRLKEFEKAVDDLDQTIRLEPRNSGAYLYRGHALRELARPEEALDSLNEALRLDPENAAALQTRASLLQEQGEYDRAEQDLANASEQQTTETMKKKRSLIAGLLQEHFAPEPTDNITITERVFPFRVRADLQRAVDRLFTASTKVGHFCGVLQRYGHEGMDFAQLITPNPRDPATSVPPQYEEMDIGEEEPVRCLKNGLWFLSDGEARFAVLLAPAERHGMVTGLKFQVAAVNDVQGTRITQEFFKHLEDSVLKSESYRGKVLSLEVRNRFSGKSSGLMVHRLRTVDREEVILPKKTLDLLDRNVIEFARQRGRLSEYGLSTKKGILFYGPPGNGKTYTIHYLAKALEGHTTFLVTAEQVGLLDEYMTLARLLQPSVVVIEDVDLIARDRAVIENPCDEVLLHKLLNEMDGLRPDADVLFILTTNRPETLETALASRPGRVDQAIEFPLPDEEGRAKLIRLYSCGLPLPDEVIEATVRKTKDVSASFIKELMRRSAQFQIERDEDATEVTVADIDNALEELLFAGGSLNRKLLGAEIDEA